MSEENQVAIASENQDVTVYNSNLPVTEGKIEEIFHQLDVENASVVRFQEAVEFYLSLEQFGLEQNEKDATEYVSKFASTNVDSLTYDEFACFILSIARW